MQQNEKWIELCAKAALESDPQKMLKLLKEINDLLDANDRRRSTVTMQLRSDPR